MLVLSNFWSNYIEINIRSNHFSNYDKFNFILRKKNEKKTYH